MQPIKIEREDDIIYIFVGEVDACGQYQVLRLSPAEAAVLMMILKEKL